MQTILAAVDGSTHADKALAFAADLAAKYGARLILVHAALHGAHAGALAQMAEERGLSAELIGELDEADRTPSPGIAVAGAYTLVPVSGSTLHRLGEELLENVEGMYRVPQAAWNVYRSRALHSLFISTDPRLVPVLYANRKQAAQCAWPWKRPCAWGGINGFWGNADVSPRLVLSA